MMIYEVYSNGCGTGKTHRIKELIKANPTTDFLVIVPSTALANEYDDVGTVVVSKDKEDNSLPNVQKRITENMLDGNARVLVITQAAFKNSKEKFDLCNNRIVVQDEELKVFEATKWCMHNHKEWMSMFDIKAHDSNWFSANIVPSIANAFISAEDDFDDLTKVEDLLATPYDVWSNNNRFDKYTQMFSVIKPEVYKGALKVIIACANFEQTFQYHIWRNLYSVDFVEVEPFVPYDGSRATIHYAGQKINSITFNKSNSSIRDTVIAYIKDNAKGELVVASDNNSFALPSTWAKVQQNCHGINKYIDAKHTAILASLNYENVTTQFLVEICLMKKEQVRFAHMGETAHQIAMRGDLRKHGKSSEHCHIYLMEQQIAFYIAHYLFDSSVELVCIPDTERPVTEKLTQALSQADKNKAFYIKKNFSAFKDIETRDIMNSVAWTLCNSRGNICNKALKANEMSEDVARTAIDDAAWTILEDAAGKV